MRKVSACTLTHRSNESIAAITHVIAMLNRSGRQSDDARELAQAHWLAAVLDAMLSTAHAATYAACASSSPPPIARCRSRNSAESSPAMSAKSMSN